MVPRHLRATDPGQKHVLPSTHQPSAAGTVAPVAPAEQPAREVTTKRKPPRGASRGERSGRGFAPPPIPRDVADDARCPQMDHVGAWGRVPNLHWCAPHDDQLRRHPRFRALPPVERLALGSEASYRYVRQGTELWDDLHRGRLTTGCLTGALGFQEEGVHRALGMGGRSGSHGPLVGAYHRLRQPLLRFDLGARTLEQEEAANEAAVRAYNENLPSPGERVDDSDTEPVSASAEATKKPRRNAKGKTKKKGGARHARAKTAAASFARAPWTASRDARSRRAAQRGEGGVRMSWGSAQEVGTVATLALRHPDAVAEEVGLCVVDRSILPASWNLGALPPMGASPDGVITLDVDVGDGRGRVRRRLAVEVKNSSPFRRCPGRPGRFVVFDREQYDTPPAYHMPQLQMEMLALGVDGGLLCMQSATRGVRVFYVARDDDYARRMLEILSSFYEEHVLTGIPPPERMFQGRESHARLVRETIRIAREAVVVEQLA